MRIVVLDNHPLCRSALGDLLRKRFGPRAIAFPSSRAEALRMVAEDPPGLIVADFQTDDVARGGLEALIEAGRGAPTVALDESHNPLRARQADLAGAQAYVCKTWTADMIEAVMAVAVAGGKYFVEADQAAELQQSGRPTLHLTGRQAEVLDLVLDGCSNREICDRLGIALPTVKIHVTAVLRALGARNRAEAMVLAGRGADAGS